LLEAGINFARGGFCNCGKAFAQKTGAQFETEKILKNEKVNNVNVNKEDV
jgi:hypothetical protein